MAKSSIGGGNGALVNDRAGELTAQRQDSLFYLLMAFAVAVAETLGFYLILALAYRVSPLESCLGVARDTGLPWLVAALLSRSFLQPLNIIVFAFAANSLLIRLYKTTGELNAFKHAYFDGIQADDKGQAPLGEECRPVLLANVEAITKGYPGSAPLLVRRLEIGARCLAQGGDAAQVHTLLQGQSAIDRDFLESRYTLVRYLIWLIPTIGFLGTVIGIGLAITQFSSVISQFASGSEDFQARLQATLADVAGNLGVAFDTTMLALLLSAFLVALTSVVQSREEGVLLEVDEFCLRRFISRIALPNPLDRLAEQMTQGLMALAQGIRDMAASPKAADGDEGVTLRDIAGRLEALPEQVRQALDDSERQRGQPLSGRPTQRQDQKG